MVYRSLTLALISSSAFIVAPAYAQTSTTSQPAPAATSTAGAEGSDGIADIIVTAQRQSESSQRAAVAISVLAPAALAQVTNPENLSKLAPALQLGSAGGSSPILYVRGVGTFTANPYTDSAVAVNYDGVYLGRPTSTFGLFYDLDRIEVLKGPQGTLYGRNATGGALNIIPAPPVIGARTMNATISAGNYDAVNAQAAVNLPISDIMALRVAGTTYTHDGYNSDGTYSDRGAGGRVQLLIKPSSDFSIRLAADYFDLGGTGNTGVLLATTNPATGATVPAGLSPNVGAYDPRSVAVLNSAFVSTAGNVYGPLPARPDINNQYYGVSSEVNAGLGFANLTVVGSWRRADIDMIAQPTSFLTQQDEKDEQYSVEARLNGKVGPVDWLIGGFYFNETVNSVYAPNQVYLGGAQTLEAKSKSYAGFGRLTFHVSDTFRLTGAARYTKDDKSFDGVSNFVTGICTSPTHLCPGAPRLPADVRNITAALASIGYIQPPGSPVYINPTGTTNLIYLPAQLAVNDSTSPSKVTYRAAAEFEPRAGSLLYASIETGYRSGGFSFSTIRPVFDPETITAYTIGSKNRFLDNRLQLNIEAFYWKYRNQQISHQAVGRTGNIEFVTENVGSSINKGVEVELVAKPLRHTLLHADVQYLDAKNKNFVFSDIDTSVLAGLPAGTVPTSVNCPSTLNAAAGTYTVNCSGLRALRSPKWTLNLGIEQTVPLSADLELRVAGNTHYQTSSIVMFERRDFSTLNSYWLSDASLTLASAKGGWSVAGFVSNIENKRVLNNSFYSPIAGITSGNYGPPRTYGARLQLSF